MFEWFKKWLGLKRDSTNTKLGRNDVCWCGSGKKYKKCHLEKDARKRSMEIADTYASSMRGIQKHKA
jgi:hypothetical protein